MRESAREDGKPPTRQRIFDAICAQPGIRFSSLRAGLGMGTGVVDHHTRMLVRMGLVATAKEGRHRCYYPGAAPPSPREPPPLGATAQALLALVTARGETSYAEIGLTLRLSKSAVSHHVQHLRARGVLELVRRAGGRHVVRLSAVRPNSQNP